MITLILLILFIAVLWRLFKFTLKIGWSILKILTTAILPVVIIFILLLLVLAAG